MPVRTTGLGPIGYVLMAAMGDGQSAHRGTPRAPSELVVPGQRPVFARKSSRDGSPGPTPSLTPS